MKSISERRQHFFLGSLKNRASKSIEFAVETKEPLTKPTVDVDTLASIDPAMLDDSFVYVHCHFSNPSDDMLIRIWRATFLIDQQSATRSQLVHAENISYAPQWTMIRKGDFTFLLIFAGLPKAVQVFDLVEEIPQPGGFVIKNIRRNETDVYHIDIL